jgi:hypothetical protein
VVPNGRIVQTLMWSVHGFETRQISFPFISSTMEALGEREQLSQYGDGLRAGKPEFDTQQEQEILVFSTASRPVLGLTQSPIQ